jgi:hypothetical protein
MMDKFMDYEEELLLHTCPWDTDPELVEHPDDYYEELAALREIEIKQAFQEGFQSIPLDDDFDYDAALREVRSSMGWVVQCQHNQQNDDYDLGPDIAFHEGQIALLIIVGAVERN